MTRIIDLTDVSPVPVSNGYLRWDTGANTVLFETTIAAQNVGGLATVATTGNVFDLINVSLDVNNPIAVGHTLVWNGTSFINAAQSGGGGSNIQFLNDLLDVTITAPSDGKTLRYNSGSGQWVDSKLNYSDILGTPVNNTYSFVGLSDTNNTVVGNGFLRWNAGSSQINYQATIATTDITGLATVATTGLYSSLIGSPTVPTTLNTLTDVSTGLPVNGNALVWNSGTSKWTPTAISSGGSTTLAGLTDVSVSTPAAGQTLRFNGSLWVNTTLGYSDLSGTPALSPVATSGSYTDLSNKPTIPTTLSTLSDVSASSPSNGQILVYNSGTSKWTQSNNPVSTRLQDSANTTFVDVATTANTVTIQANNGNVNFTVPASGAANLISANGLNVGVNSSTTSFVKIQGLKYPNADGAPGQVLTTNGSGVLSFTAPPSGVTTFIQLSDAPNSYLGHGGQIVAVKSDASGLEFITANSAVNSVFSRTGNVVATTGDYNTNQITNSSGVPGNFVTDALNNLLVSKLNLVYPAQQSHFTSLTLLPGTTATSVLANTFSGQVFAMGTTMTATINGTLVTFNVVSHGPTSDFATPNLADSVDMATAINAAAIPNVTASGGTGGTGGVLVITCSTATPITIVNGTNDISGHPFAGPASTSGVALSTSATGNIVDSGFTSTSFATALQGSHADSAVQPGQSNTLLTNGAGYLTSLSSHSIDELSDVSTGGITTGQILIWNGTSFVPGNNAGSGSASFIGLLDTPSTFSGQAGKYVAVNGGANALVFVTPPGSLITSVFGRTGVVVSAAGDYTDAQINNTSSVSGTHVSDALSTLGGNITTLTSSLNLKADKVSGAVSGHFASLTGAGNLADSGFSSSSFATASQGLLAASAVQPGANISVFVNNSGYIASLATHSINELSDVDTVTVPPTSGQVLAWNGTNFVPANPGSGGGSTTFIGLSDTPGNYTGAAGKLLAVNSSANAVTYVANTIATEYIKVAYNLNGTVTSVGANVTSQSAGISSITFTSTVANNILMQVAFTGYATPPVSVHFYGYAYDSNSYNLKLPTTTGNVINPGGSVGSPGNILTSFASMSMTNKVDRTETGASNGSGAPGNATHAIIVYKF